MTPLGEAEARLRQRQLALRLRSAELRAALAEDARALAPVLRWGDRGLQAWTWLRAAPWAGRLALAGASLWLLRRPARALRLLGQGLGWWRLLGRLRELLRRPPAGEP